jgi:hypothetical protein
MEVNTGGVTASWNIPEAEALGRELAATVRLHHNLGLPLPTHLRAFSEEMNVAIRGSAWFRSNMQASAHRGTGEFRAEPSSPSCDQPVRLSIKEAAQLAQVSESFMRRCCRRGDVQASQGRRSAWAVDVSSLAVWISQHRKETEFKKAA